MHKYMIQGKHAAAEQKLKQERATLTRFDAEINELDEVIKAKEQALSDIELSIKRVEHEVQTLQKDRVTSNNAISTLEKAYEWIVDEKK
jgi:structural maintenance of chromosome 2